MEGPWSWIEHHDDFQHWLACEDTNPDFYVIMAQFGAGKTDLTTHVVSLLQELKHSYVCHFLQFGDEQSQPLTTLLRSISYEMALATEAFYDTLLRLHENGLSFSMDDARTVWDKTFKNCLFRVNGPLEQHSFLTVTNEMRRRTVQTLNTGLLTVLMSVPSTGSFSLPYRERPSFQLRVTFTNMSLPNMPRLFKSAGSQPFTS